MLPALQRTASAFDRAAWAVQLAPLMKLWDSLAASQPQMLHQAQQQQPAGAVNAAPLDAFVAQEAAAARLLATAVHGSLASLRQTLAGTAVLTPAVQVSCMTAFRWDLQLPCIQYSMQPRQPCSSLLSAHWQQHVGATGWSWSIFTGLRNHKPLSSYSNWSSCAVWFWPVPVRRQLLCPAEAVHAARTDWS